VDIEGADEICAELCTRRVVTRCERNVENYLGMVPLACALILLRASIR
jgi:hypothetical protein